jgi:8-oxo-dGTP pyrophosphatase MutT (NUDIX family)
LNTILRKVSAFITRESPAGRELLVFAHPNPRAGIQVPAGTVEAGEAPERAVLRETWEETGLSAVRIVQSAIAIPNYLPTDLYALTQPTTLRQGPTHDSPVQNIDDIQGAILHSGSYLALRRTIGEWAEVSYDLYDPRSQPPFQPVVVTGWVPTTVLASQLVRTLYHLETLEPTPDTWERLAEERYLFRFSWLSLIPRPCLVMDQDTWLDLIYEQLLEFRR